MVALVLVLLTAAGAPAAPAAAGPGDPVAAELDAAARALARDRGGPRGLAALARLDAIEPEVQDLARLALAYQRTVEDRGAHPEVRALARLLLARAERARGNLQREAALLRRAGFLGRFAIAGPFDDEGRRGHDLAYGPEAEAAGPGEVDLARRFPGKGREVGWRALPADAVTGGFVHLGAAVRPAREVVVYALAAVEAEREERVVLWLGASGAAKVWVNGALVLADPADHPARPDQRGVRVTLRRGANRLLVKLAHQDGRMGFHLRLADDRGEGRILAPVDPAARPAPGPAPAPAAVEGAVEALARAADEAARGKGPAARRAEAEARLALARALAERQVPDVRERRAAAEARRAAELAVEPAPDAALLAAELDDAHGRRRALLEGVLERAPEDARALAALAREELADDRAPEAVRLARRAVAAAPAWAAARALLADALGRAGLEAEGHLAAEAAVADLPAAPEAVRAAARSARRLSRVDLAAARLRTVLALRLDDAGARGELAALLVARGDVDGAAALLEEGLRLDPSGVDERLRLAALLAANGRLDAAEPHFARAIALSPDEADAHARRGRARLLAGRADAAREDLARALELRPQDPELKELVRSLEPARERFERPYLLDARALAAAPPVPAPEGAAAEDAVVLGDLKVTRVLPSGQSAEFTQTVVRVLTPRGADAWRRPSVPYAPGRQEVRLERARILKPDGTVVSSWDEGDRSLSEPWYRLYYDLRARSVTLPALAPGDVLEVAWRVEDVAGENLLSDYFGALAAVDGEARKDRFEWIVLMPAGRALHASVPAGVERAERALAGGAVEHRFAARGVPRLVPEPNMPGWAETSKVIHVSTYASWREVNRFYWGLVRDQLRPTAELRAIAARLARGALGERAPAVQAGHARSVEDERKLVRAAHGFVVTQTRYVGLEFGIHGYKPYRVDEVLQRRFGDCKDKAGLLHALLGALGVESRLVLLRMRRLGRIAEAPASLAVFNHAILYVPRLDLWLDGTASFSGTRELPGEDRGASVLVIDPGDAPRFGRVPEAAPEDNVLDTALSVALAPDGSARIQGRSTIRGVQAPAYRRAYASAPDRAAVLEQSFNALFPGLSVEAADLPGLADLEADVRMDFTLSVPRYARLEDGRLAFTPFGAIRGYQAEYAALSSRRHDLVLGDPRTTRFTYRYALPPGASIASLPAPARGETPHAAFEVAYREEGGAVVAEGHVTFRAGRVPVADYPAFRALTGAIDRAFAARVEIAAPTPEASARKREDPAPPASAQVTSSASPRPTP
jgi:tetratricopeptide (TPR) repeat protein